MWDRYLDLFSIILIVRLVRLRKIANKFLAPLSGRYDLVWIDIFEKEKFANLSKSFLLFSYFYLFII